MVRSLPRFDQPQADLLGRPGVVLGYELREAVAKEVGRAVAHVEQRYLASPYGRDDHRAAHAQPVGVVLRCHEHGLVGFFAGTLQTLDVGALLPILREDLRHRADRERARLLARAWAAQAI